jgi:hypothetical protein
MLERQHIIMTGENEIEIDQHHTFSVEMVTMRKTAKSAQMQTKT